MTWPAKLKTVISKSRMRTERWANVAIIGGSVSDFFSLVNLIPSGGA